MRCTGGWPKTSGTFSNAIFAITSGSTGQTVEAVCTHNNVNSCFTPAGAAFPYPSGLPATSDAAVEGWGDNNNIGARYYYINGNKSFGCWDFTLDTTGSACAGYSQGQVLGTYVYAVTADPTIRNCLWSNADNGTRITPFNAVTGAVGCTQSSPEVTFPHERTAPRLACEPVPGATAWREFRLTLPPATTATGYSLVVRDSNGIVVPGWDSVDLGTQGTFANGIVSLDLSSLSVVSTGATPEFTVITANGTTDTEAEGLRAQVVFDSAPAQLCFDLQVATLRCPLGTGIASSATPSALPMSVTSRTLVTASGLATQASSTNDGTMGATSGCLGTVVGVAVDGNGNPVAGVPVSFKTGATTHATVNTGDDGRAVFTNVYPFLVSTSTLEFTSSSTFRPVSESAVVSLAALTATSTVTGSAVTYERTVVLPAPASSTPTTTPAMPTSTTTTTPRTPTTTAPPSPVISVPPASTPRTPPPGVEPVRVADPTGSTALPELPPGESQVLDNGVPVNVDIAVENTTDLVMSGDDWELRLKGDCSVRLCTISETNAREVLELEVDGAANVNGFGFKPGTLVHIWLFSDPIYLGSLLVAEDSTFVGSVDLRGVDFGEHTLQVNGISYDDKQRTANLGVIINPNVEAPPTDRLPATGTDHTTTVWLGLLLVVVGSGIVIRRRYG